MEKTKTKVNTTITLENCIKTLSNLYINAIQKRIEFKKLPSVMLWGEPGIGKSQAIRQIANEIEIKTSRHTHVIDVRLLLFNPIDLRGIPTSNLDKTAAVWLKPQIFQMDESEQVVNILFLDEISAAPLSVQAAAYQIVLDRVIGEHKLPDNCIVLAAGNRVTDRSAAYKMPKALANRLLHLEIEGSFTAWKKWAIQAHIHPMVIGFLSFKQESLFGFDPNNDDVSFATPRTWEMVSNLLNNITEDVNEIYELISGLIGRGTAIEFTSWCRVYRDLPDIKSIFMGIETKIPKSTDGLFALVSSMTRYASEHPNNWTEIGNSITYSHKMPPEYAALLLENYLLISDDFAFQLRKLPQFLEYSEKRGILLNGII